MMPTEAGAHHGAPAFVTLGIEMSMPEIRTRHLAKIDLPVQFSRLRDIAYNLWWSWSPNAQALFEVIDHEHWLHYRSPIEVLIDLDPERWRYLQNSAEFIRLSNDFCTAMCRNRQRLCSRHDLRHTKTAFLFKCHQAHGFPQAKRAVTGCTICRQSYWNIEC